MKTVEALSQLETFKKTKCRYCNRGLPNSFLDLGTMALANSFLRLEELNLDEFTCPLNLTLCENCKLVQLTHVVPAEKMFLYYLYVSSTTKTFQDHFMKYAEMVRSKLSQHNNALAIDIGSNDGLLLSCYQKTGMRAVGVEPAKNLSDEANRKGFVTINRFFDEHSVSQIIRAHGKADAVSANNVFAHIDNVKDVCRNVNNLLHDHGLFVIEFPYLVTMFEEMFFDMIYHEHLSYISITALNYFMDSQGFKIVDVQKVSSHGGSLRVFCAKKMNPISAAPIVNSLLKDEGRKGYQSNEIYFEFSKNVEDVKKTLRSFVSDIRSKKQTVSGYGAPAKGNTIINYCGFDRKDIEYIVDDNPLKQNTYSPGAHIPIVPSEYLKRHPTNYVVIFAWNFANEILSKIGHLKSQNTKFIVPLPKPKIV